jgi:AraC-like DNA-binding protein
MLAKENRLRKNGRDRDRPRLSIGVDAEQPHFELAAAAAMSRTSFALHFKAATGVAPLAYLTQWRMRLAERALREDTIAVSGVARRHGYSSDRACSNAFKRVTGSAPNIYRSAVRARPELAAE